MMVLVSSGFNAGLLLTCLLCKFIIERMLEDLTVDGPNKYMVWDGLKHVENNHHSFNVRSRTWTHSNHHGSSMCQSCWVIQWFRSHGDCLANYLLGKTTFNVVSEAELFMYPSLFRCFASNCVDNLECEVVFVSPCFVGWRPLNFAFSKFELQFSVIKSPPRNHLASSLLGGPTTKGGHHSGWWSSQGYKIW